MLDTLGYIDFTNIDELREKGLREYFVVTGQATQAKQGHARLVNGRKGSGKTAVFYDVRNSIGRRNDRLILDLKPEGHQFTKLRELVLDRLGPGMLEHTMVAFWNYILLGVDIRQPDVQDDRIEVALTGHPDGATSTDLDIDRVAVLTERPLQHGRHLGGILDD